MIAVVTDSSAQLPARRAEAAGIAVVPLTVLLGDEERLEGVDLDVDEFYDHLGDDGSATTSLPSPGRFAALYDDLLERAAGEIVSVHVAGAVSGTVGAARLAAEGLPVHVVDTGQVSFGVAICALEAAAVVAAGGSADDAQCAIEDLGPSIGNAFVARGTGGGRLRLTEGDGPERLLSFTDGRADVLGEVPPSRVADALASTAAAAGTGLRAAVGASDASTFGPADRLAGLLGERPEIVAVDRYRVGPSVGAHTGAGTYGVYWWPATTVRESA